MLLSFPDLVLSLTLQYLEPSDIARVSQCCSYLHYFIDQNEVWTDLFSCHFPYREFQSDFQRNDSKKQKYREFHRSINGKYLNIGQYNDTDYEYEISFREMERTKFGRRFVGETVHFNLWGLKIGSTILAVQFYEDSKLSEGYYAMIIGSIDENHLESRWIASWTTGISAATKYGDSDWKLLKQVERDEQQDDQAVIDAQSLTNQLRCRLDKIPRMKNDDMYKLFHNGTYTLTTPVGCVEITLLFENDEFARVTLSGTWKDENDKIVKLKGIANTFYLQACYETDTFKTLECFILHASPDLKYFEGFWSRLDQHGEIHEIKPCTLRWKK